VNNPNQIFNAVSEFKDRQIVCLEHQNICLYGEVIQVIHKRKLCWVRPLILAIAEPNTNFLSQFPDWEEFIDVRDTSDLLWPIDLFRTALDTEVIPFLGNLESEILDSDSDDRRKNSHKLHWFIKEVWQSHQTASAQRTEGRR
jgi:hypothetical protein